MVPTVEPVWLSLLLFTVALVLVLLATVVAGFVLRRHDQRPETRRSSGRRIRHRT